MSKKHVFSNSKSLQQITALIVILIVASIGTYLLTNSHAATPYASVTADSGTVTGNATKQACSGATDGNCVAFPASSGGGTTPSNKVIISINNATGYGNGANEPVTLFKGIGVTWTRVFTDQIAQTVQEGMHPLPTLEPGNGPDGNCTGETPADITAAVQAILPTLKQYSVPYLEICNESYLSEPDTAYAAQYNAAHAALAGTGIKALAVATALGTGCGADTTPNWIPTVIADLPGGASEVDAWTIHPYGPVATPQAGSGCDPSSVVNSYGWDDVVNWHTIAVNAGSNAPWFITEVGQCLGENNGTGNCGSGVSQATQAAAMTTYLNDVVTYPWVAYFNWYASCDDSSGDWGLIARENSSNGGTDNGVCDAGVRPAFTAMQTWMSQNASKVGD